MNHYRVVQWGTGYTGNLSLKYILGNPKLKLVGVRCHTADKEGKDAGELIGAAATGVLATRDTAALLANDADCVIFMPRDMHVDPSLPGSPAEDWWVRDLVALAESGKNVITPICTGTHWRHMVNGQAFHDRIEAACRKGNATVHFTGFDPGFATDAIATMLANAVGSIKQIRTWEIIDYASYPVPDVLRNLGFGVYPQDLPPGGKASVPVGWGGALHLMADAMGVTIDEIKLSSDVYLSPTRFIASGGLLVEKGMIGASRWELSAIIQGKSRFVINHVNRIGPDMAPDWPNIGADGGYRVEIDGFPPLRADFPMGLPGGTGTSFADAMAMAAARCVNSIEPVVSAAPGYKTFLELSPLLGKYAMTG